MSTAPRLWFTSRTPIEEGQTHCAYARYLGYHAGPHGTGYRRRQTALPLATGEAVHAGLESVGRWLIQTDQPVPSREVIAQAATSAADTYGQTVRTHGLAFALDEPPDAQATVIHEQQTLIEGLIWVWALVQLPRLLLTHRVIGVEVEEILLLDCTCGLGEAISDWRLHAQRQCAGIVQQGRADWLLASRSSDEITYLEVKTKSTPNLGWERAWEHSGQLLINMEAASRRLGQSVSQAEIHVLYKGRRDKAKTAGPEVWKMQQSPLCYGIYEPGSGGGSWHPRWHREPWVKTVPIWDPQYPMAPVRAGASRVESWVTRHMAALAPLTHVLGPFPRPSTRVPAALQSLRASERRWRDAIEAIRAGADPEEQIDRSWHCTGFDGTPCAFQPVCFQEPDADQLYEIRTPHHAPERAAWEACGLTFPRRNQEDCP
jgi:hypothetical protein